MQGVNSTIHGPDAICKVQRRQEKGRRSPMPPWPLITFANSALQVLQAGPHHPSITEYIDSPSFGRIGWPLPSPPRRFSVRQGPVDLSLLYPPAVEGTAFANGQSQKTAIGLYLGAQLVAAEVDFDALTFNISNLPVIPLPGTNLLTLSDNLGEIRGGPSWKERRRMYLSLVALCVMFQVGPSIQQDATRSKGWLSTIQRTCSEAGKLYWVKVVGSDLRGVSASDVPEKLLSIASRANFAELEEMVRQIELIHTSSSPMLTHPSPSVLQILSLRPHASAVRWLVDIKRAAITAHDDGLTVTRHILLPDFASAAQNVKPSEISPFKFTSLFNQTIMALTKALDSVSPGEVATIVALHYPRNQALYLIVLLTLEAYDVPHWRHTMYPWRKIGQAYRTNLSSRPWSILSCSLIPVLSRPSASASLIC